MDTCLVFILPQIIFAHTLPFDRFQRKLLTFLKMTLNRLLFCWDLFVNCTSTGFFRCNEIFVFFGLIFIHFSYNFYLIIWFMGYSVMLINWLLSIEGSIAYFTGCCFQVVIVWFCDRMWLIFMITDATRFWPRFLQFYWTYDANLK